MKTFIYMVRHAESPYSEGNERIRGLSPNGLEDARTVTGLLKDEGINVIVSSPYARAVLTVEGLSRHLKFDILLMEDLRERLFSGDDYIISDDEFAPAVEKMFSDPNYALPGGESNHLCQQRAVQVLNQLLADYKGQKIAVGTHGNVMTLMMNYFDPMYGLEFLNGTSKPDVYKMEFEDTKLVAVQRMWKV